LLAACVPRCQQHMALRFYNGLATHPECLHMHCIPCSGCATSLGCATVRSAVPLMQALELACTCAATNTSFVVARQGFWHAVVWGAAEAWLGWRQAWVAPERPPQGTGAKCMLNDVSMMCESSWCVVCCSCFKGWQVTMPRRLWWLMLIISMQKLCG
jgi:hypothetical protein